MKREVTASISRSERRLIAGLIVLAALVRFFRLGAQSLWVDEMLTLIAATPKPGIPLGTLLLHNIHGPLHTFVVALMRTASESEWWLRLPSAIAGVGSVPLLYAWVRPRLGSRTATWAALLLAINPLHLHYSQELRNYAFAVFFVILACVLLDRLCARWSLARAVAFAASVAAAVLCNFSAVFAFAVQAVVFARNTAPRSRAALRWLAVTAMVILITSPWIYRVTTFVDFGKLATPVQPGALDPAERLRGDTTFRWESIPYTFYAYSVGFALGPSLAEMHGDLHATVRHHRAAIAWTALVFGALAITGLVAIWRRSAWRGAELVLYIAVPLVATLALNWQNAKAFNVRYVLIGLPMYLALVAAGIEAVGGKRRVLALVLVMGTCVPALFNYYRDPARQKEDVRDAV
ncbi:MAG TPA: glycosyltransferase family 39 protein, partial [Candidatus Krumholzibacteria bacterium]|nr:glycosyltransferase family 39 protein [Candidatus Krumholzibacteria bacterium]